MNGRIVWLFHLLCSTGAALQMTGPSTYEARVGSIAHIPCTFTADILPADPKFFAVFWHLEGKRVLSYDNTVISTDPRYSLDIDQALNGAADLTISNTFLSDGGIYTCSVTNSPIQREKQIKVEISGAALQMTGPSTYTARVGSSTNIPCTFTADTLPVDPTFFAIVWYLEKKRILTYDNTVTSTHPRYSLDKDQALNGIVNLTISNPSVSDGGVYTCSVNYSSFQLERKIRVDVSAQPQLFILDKIVQRNTENNLTCMANGYFPNDITVTWHKDGEVLKNQSMGESLKYNNGTYQVKSTVTIIPSDNDLNKTFSCRIQHVSLQEPLQEEFQLTYQESSSRVGIINPIVIAVVVIIGIGIIAAVILCRRRIRRKASDRASVEEMDGQEVSENMNSFKVKEEEMGLTSTNKGQLPDPKIEDIKVPELIEGKKATLECKIFNYRVGTHRAIWYVKEKSSDQFIEVNSASKISNIIRHESDTDTYVAKLALVPVQKSDDGSQFLCKVDLPDSERVIEKYTGPVQVKDLQVPRKYLRFSFAEPAPKQEEEISKMIPLIPLARRTTMQKENRNSPLNRQLPDPKMEDITVPELIEGKKMTLECRIFNYRVGTHSVIWYVKEKSSDQFIEVNPASKILNIRKHESDTDPYVAELTLFPVQKSDDGSEFLCRVNLPDSERVIEKYTGPVQVEDLQLPGQNWRRSIAEPKQEEESKLPFSKGN